MAYSPPYDSKYQILLCRALPQHISTNILQLFPPFLQHQQHNNLLHTIPFNSSTWLHKKLTLITFYTLTSHNDYNQAKFYNYNLPTLISDFCHFQSDQLFIPILHRWAERRITWSLGKEAIWWKCKWRLWISRSKWCSTNCSLQGWRWQRIWGYN